MTRCTNCGTGNPSYAGYCSACGHGLAAAPTGPFAAPAAVEPHVWVPPSPGQYAAAAPYAPPGPYGAPPPFQPPWPPPPPPASGSDRRGRWLLLLGISALIVLACVLVVLRAGGAGDVRIDGQESVSGFVLPDQSVTHVVTVPAGATARIVVEPSADFDVTLTVYPVSGGPVYVDPGYGGDAETYELPNYTSAEVSVTIEIAGFSGDSGSYDVQLIDLGG